MAIETSIPKEITEYKEKILFGLSLRQLICVGSAVVLSIGTYFLCTKVFGLSMDFTSYIIIIEAIPIMALGFIKIEGMPFEKYAALFIRHKMGNNKLSYATKGELLLKRIEDLNTIETEKPAERKSKYAWIFEKETTGKGKPVRSRKEQQKEKFRRECKLFTVSKESRKRKSKETQRKIKAARQEYREAKRRAQKEAKAAGSA